jgi:hypothetical protein
MSYDNTKSIHIWTRNETEILTRAYLNKKLIKEIQDLLPDIKLSSIRLKLINCSHLEKAYLNKTVSKMHQDVWNELTSAYALPDVDEISVAEYDICDNKIPEEDGEEYFKCTGTCDKVKYYEETDEFGMCGMCQLTSKQKQRK